MDQEFLERFIRVEEAILRLEFELLGNGQPGKLALIDQRVGRLEKWKARMGGGLAVVGFIGAAILLAVKLWRW